MRSINPRFTYLLTYLLTTSVHNPMAYIPVEQVYCSSSVFKVALLQQLSPASLNRHIGQSLFERTHVAVLVEIHFTHLPHHITIYQDKLAQSFTTGPPGGKRPSPRVRPNFVFVFVFVAEMLIFNGFGHFRFRPKMMLCFRFRFRFRWKRRTKTPKFTRPIFKQRSLTSSKLELFAGYSSQ